MDLEPIPPTDDHDSAPESAGPGTQPETHRFSRRARIGAGALALVTVGAAAWTAGTALNHTSTVHVQPASATATATGTSGPSGAHRSMRRGMRGMGGVGGTVTGTPATTSFDVSSAAPMWRASPGANGTTGTSGATATPAAPTTRTVNVVISSSTTYRQVKSSTGALTGVASGARIVARGTRNVDGSLQATNVSLLGAAPARAPMNSRAPMNAGHAGTRGGPNVAARAASAPFVFGTVTADSATGTLTVTTPWGSQTVDTGSATTTTQIVAATYAAVVSGARVLVTGARSEAGTVTATSVLIVPAGITAGRAGFGGFGMFGGGFMGPMMGGRFGGPGHHFTHQGQGGTAVTPTPAAV